MNVSTECRHANRLVAAVPAAERLRWGQQLEPVELARGQVLYEPGETPRHVVFPGPAVVSVRGLLGNGSSTEIAQVGGEGLIGIAVFLGGQSNPCRAVVASPGAACRVPVAVMRESFERCRTMQGLVLRFIQAAFTQMAQTAVCNRQLSLDMKLWIWILMILYRMAYSD
ncbi:MAG: hypothetical protein RLZZ524_350, partial [Pseudomonadota bacterium]